MAAAARGGISAMTRNNGNHRSKAEDHPPEEPVERHAPPGGNNHHGNGWMEKFSRLATAWAGSSWAFALATLVILVWIVSGPIFNFSDTWQLVINTGTTIVTFLMVFLIQRSQNKDGQAIQLKLNELLASQQGASNQLINIEDWSEEDISQLHKQFEVLTEHLQTASDNCEAHSVAEARAALAQAQDVLRSARPKLGRSKREKSNPQAR
jgi:low affinity Fe/Cu permease